MKKPLIFFSFAIRLLVFPKNVKYKTGKHRQIPHHFRKYRGFAQFPRLIFGTGKGNCALKIRRK
jgi:hypothetical protein